MNLNSICEAVVLLSKKTGEFILSHSENFDQSKIEYKGVNNLVSFVDKQAEIMLVEGLNKILPEAGFITEEGTSSVGRKDLSWVIDPLDGTTNFLHSLPLFSISIGLIQDNEPILGVVLDLGRNDCYFAHKNSVAFKNGKTIHISQVTRMEDGLLATGFPYMEFDQMKQYLDILTEFMKSTHGLRRLGSAAIDLAYVAHGRFEGYFEYNLQPWDVAGGAMIVKQAGGIVTDFEGGNDYLFGKSIIAASPIVHRQMLEIIKRYWNK